MSQPRIIRLCVVGAAGRMGRRLIQAAAQDPGLRVSSALESAALAETDLGLAGLRLSADPRQALVDVDLVIDFSAPATAAILAPLCVERRLPYIVGSTALGEADERSLTAASRVIPVLVAANFSIGVNLALELVETAARRLGPEFAIEVLELHHDKKRDAPSGTAVALTEAARRGRGELETIVGRSGVSSPRRSNEIGVAALRGGDVTGEHTVFFLGTGERVEVSHRATTLEIFARGALRAAHWLNGQPAGRYTMRDVLGNGAYG